MRSWSAARIAAAAGAQLVGAGPGDHQGPRRVTIDTRELEPGDLFVGLPGARVDGGALARDALAAGAWGALVANRHAAAAGTLGAGAVLAADDPLAALGALARAWRRELGCATIAITGSTGKTSTKDILAALLAPHRRTVATHANLNTEVGLPLQILAAPPGTQALVLELAMRGAGQIAQLTGICEPDVGVIVNVGPVHLEPLGSLEAVAAAKAELIAGLRSGATVAIPAGEALLEPHLRDDVEVVTFGPGGDVALTQVRDGGRVEIDARGVRLTLEPSFDAVHQRTNLLAAVAAAQAIGVAAQGRLDVVFSARRGERIALSGGGLVIDDCYNANPMSMRAALHELAGTPAPRRVAVLGDMLELGADEVAYHEALGAQAREAGVDLLIAVGPLAAHATGPFAGDARHAADAREAAAVAHELVAPGDAVLVKGSRGVGLEAVTVALTAREALA